MAIARTRNQDSSLTMPWHGFGRRGSLARREAIWGLALISPWLIGLLIFWIGPLLAAFSCSFTDYPILSAPTWIGLANYQQIFTAVRDFWVSLGNTAYYVLIRVPLHLGLALVLAMLLNRATRGIGIFRTLIYLPSMVPVVALAVAWRVLLDPRTGYVNYVADLLGLPQVNYLTSSAWIKPVIIGMSLWQVGIAMIVFIAGLAGVPEQLSEAVKIDGASAWQRFRHVTIPMITPVIPYNVIIDIINSFQVFAYAFIVSDGGPRNASFFCVLYIYQQAFEFFRMGYAAALAVILFLIILALAAVLMRWSNTWVHYERV